MLSDEDLKKELEDATNGLLFISEVDYPFDVFFWENTQDITVNRNNVLKLTGFPPDIQIEECSLDFLFRWAILEQDWQNEEEVRNVKRFQHLFSVIKSNLIDIIVFRLGRIELNVYIIGRTESGILAGLKTKQFET